VLSDCIAAPSSSMSSSPSKWDSAPWKTASLRPEICQLQALDGPIVVLVDERQIQNTDDAAVDQVDEQRLDWQLAACLGERAEAAAHEGGQPLSAEASRVALTGRRKRNHAIPT
jgi:hypothetical protein